MEWTFHSLAAIKMHRKQSDASDNQKDGAEIQISEITVNVYH